MSFLGRRVGQSSLDPPPPSRSRGAEGVSDTFADFCRLQSLRRIPPYPPTLPKVAGKIADRRPSDAKISIFGRPFADRKFIKNRTPQKSLPNRKNRIPEHRNVDFGIILGPVLASIFNDFSTFSKKRESLNNTVKPQ